MIKTINMKNQRRDLSMAYKFELLAVCLFVAVLVTVVLTLSIMEL